MLRLEKHLREQGYADDAFFEEVAESAQQVANGVREAVLDLRGCRLRVFLRPRLRCRNTSRWKTTASSTVTTSQALKRSKHERENIERLTLAKAITRGLEDAMEADRTVVHAR